MRIKNGFIRLVFLSLFWAVFSPGTAHGVPIEELPTSDLLRRAAVLSGDLTRLNRELLTELTGSRELSESLRRELNEALKELDGLKAALETQWTLAETSQAELNAVSGLLRITESELRNLTGLYESSLSAIALQTGRANKAERSVKIWRVIGIAGILIAAGGIAAAAVF
jgi:hypothetical protein